LAVFYRREKRRSKRLFEMGEAGGPNGWTGGLETVELDLGSTMVDAATQTLLAV
jgi:hypothetical protein